MNATTNVTVIPAETVSTFALFMGTPAEQQAVEAVASDAIRLQREIAELEAKLDVRKEQLRHYAAGETKNIVLNGVGKIDITKPVEAKVTTVLEANYDTFKTLVPEMQALFLNSGVVAVKDKKSSARAASVKITPNV